MIAPVLYGVFAAIGVSLVLGAAGASPMGVSALIWLIPVGLLLAGAQWFHSRGRVTPSEQDLEQYDGIPDLLIHLHSPATPDRSTRWAFRGLVSWILTTLGLPIGPEGGATELVQAAAMRMRGSSNRWSDLVRRSDAAMALAAGISAAFGAPFAGVLISSELAIGGRALSSVLASLSAFMTSQYLSKLLAGLGVSGVAYRDRLGSIWGFRLLDWREWLVALIAVAAASVIGALGLIGLRQVREFVARVSRGRSYWMTLVAVFLLGLAVMSKSQFLSPAPNLFEQVIRGEWSAAGCLGLAGYLFLVLMLVGAGLGTAGVWWPVFLLGVVVSFGLVSLIPVSFVSRGFVPNAALLGAVALSSVWMRTPISLAVLAFEITQNGSLLLPCLIAAALARWIDRRMGQTAWVDQLLKSKGFAIQEGRAVAVLQALKVRDAMVTNFETVHELDSVRVCHEKIRECHYPFLAVLDNEQKFKGLLTVDVIEKGLLSQLDQRLDDKLGSLLEARDLLFRSPVSLRTVRADTSLADLRGVFEGQSCIAVLSDDGRAVGLMFAHDVRQCYDREVARRSFVIQANQNSRLSDRVSRGNA